MSERITKMPLDEFHAACKSMPLRDVFAGQALTGLMMSQWGKVSYEELAKKSYAAADAMLAERNRKEEVSK